MARPRKDAESGTKIVFEALASKHQFFNFSRDGENEFYQAQEVPTKSGGVKGVLIVDAEDSELLVYLRSREEFWKESETISQKALEDTTTPPLM